ncbi:MAG: hypothetical protein JRJ87_12940 [Deltaproteobacteria bacterium]|nr:hypothetical protein [Deltaproteobacteria bacterium]
MPVRHCPNPDCPYRAKHGRPAEYRAGIATCSDCGAELADGKGSFDADDLRSAKPLEDICNSSSTNVKDLGKADGELIVLLNAPGAISLPVIQLVAGLGVLVISFYYINQRHFVAVIPALIGFGLFFIGFNRIKHSDRRARRVRLYQRGFAYHIGEKIIAVLFTDIEMVSLSDRQLRHRGVPIGVFHDLLLACRGQVYTLTSFESHAGLYPRETSRFVLWAKKVVEGVMGTEEV